MSRGEYQITEANSWNTCSRKEQDPTGLDQHQAGAKLDKGKPMAHLLLDFKRAIRGVLEVSTVGAIKYTQHGWVEVENGYERYTAALIRHLFADEEIDPDSGLLVDAQIAWNALARLELKLRRTDLQEATLQSYEALRDEKEFSDGPDGNTGV